MPVVYRCLDRQQLDGSDAEAHQVVDHRWGGEAIKCAAVRRLDFWMLHRYPAHMQFENDCLLPGGLRTAVIAPCEGRLDDAAFRDIARIVAPVERQVIARASDAIAKHGIAPAHSPLKSLGVGIDQ